MMKSGIERISQEREEQIKKHGRTVTHDVECNNEYQLIDAVSALLLDVPEETVDTYYEVHGQHPPVGWNSETWLHMLKKPYKERIVIAGALIAAEYDRVEALESLNQIDEI